MKKTSIKRLVSSLYAKKLNKALDDRKSDTKLKRLMKKKVTKIVLLASAFVSVGVAIYYHPEISKTVIAFNSKICSKIHNLFAGNVNSKTDLEVATEAKSNRGKWALATILLITVVAGIFLSNDQDREIEVIETEVIPVAAPAVVTGTKSALSFVKRNHLVVGFISCVGALPAAFAEIISPPAFIFFHCGGYILATWVYYD